MILFYLKLFTLKRLLCTKRFLKCENRKKKYIIDGIMTMSNKNDIT